jgi:HPt (histidine-containing phosphotransfer) domain-containing protein
MKRPVNGMAHKGFVMAYDPGALNASLAAAVGSDSELMAELRAAFLESAIRQLDLMGRARCDANWVIAASRLKSLAASFGATGLVELASDALEGAPGDPVVLRNLAAAVDEFAAI